MQRPHKSPQFVIVCEGEASDSLLLDEGGCLFHMSFHFTCPLTSHVISFSLLCVVVPRTIGRVTIPSLQADAAHSELLGRFQNAKTAISQIKFSATAVMELETTQKSIA